MKHTPTEQIRELTRRRQSMDAEFNLWEPHFQEVATAILPSRGRFSGTSAAGVGINKRIIDSAAAKALRTLRAGMMSGMTSPQRPWFRLGLYDDAVMERPGVKAYLETVQKRMYTVLRGSNVYSTLYHCYGDVGLYGTFAGIIRSHPTKVIDTMALPMGRYVIAESQDGTVDTIHYDCRMSVRQLVDQFGYDACSTTVQRHYDRGNMSEWIDVHYAIEPRADARKNSPLNTDMPYAAYYWEKGKSDQLLYEGGFPWNPILAPRWESQLGETYSVSSPGMMAIGDAMQLQVQQREKMMGIQMQVRPPMLAPAGWKSKFRQVPGGVTTMDSQDLQKGGLIPAHQVKPDVQALMYDINETRQRISQSFFEDLFMLTIASDRREVTAREIAERHEEKLIVLGPVLEALDHSLLQPLVETTYNYMAQSYLLPEAPEDLQGAPLKVEYISLLAQAQKMVGTAAIERTLGFAGSLAQIKPEVLDNLDADVAMREFADQVGPPVEMIRDPQVVAEVRKQRAEQQQQQQMMEQAQPMANAAKLISEANERGERVLQQQRGVA